MRHKLLRSKTTKFLDSIDPPTEEEKARSQRIGVPVREMRKNDKLLAMRDAEKLVEKGLAAVPAAKPDDLFSDVQHTHYEPDNVYPLKPKEEPEDGAA